MKASKHAAGGTDAVSTYSQNLWKYSKKVYKMKYNGIIRTFLFMSQESKKCITSFSSKIFLLGKLSQLTRKKPKVNKQICFSRWLVKFICSEKATKFCEIFTLLLSYVVPVKSKVKNLLNFVAFSECMNFKFVRYSLQKTFLAYNFI